MSADAPARRWKPYPAYRNSGVEWLREIPMGWNVNRIKFTSYVKGRVGWHGLRSDEFTDVGPFLVTGTDFSNGKINWETCHHFSEERYNEDPYIQLKENDLLITKDGTIGKVAIVEKLSGKASLNSGIMLIRPLKKHYMKEFMFWVLNSNLFSEYNEYTKAGSTIQHLYQETFEDFSFPVPPFPEQRVIASFLDRETAHLDALITKKERLIALLEEKRAALISSMVTKGLDTNAPMKDSGVEWLGEVQEHWNVKRLKYIAPVSNEKLNEKPDELLYLGLEQVESKTGRLLLDTPVENVESMVSVFEKGDVLFGKLRPYLSKVVYAEFNGVCTSELLVLKPNSASYGKFLFYQLISDDFINLINSMTYGTKMPRASSEQISNNYVPYPNLPEQRAIASYLDRETARIDALISKVKEGIEKLREYRTAIISAAVTGIKFILLQS